jgi:FlaA1/EpsC-like NDP-sugar epimerase
VTVWRLFSRMQRWVDWTPSGWSRYVVLLALDSAIISLSYYTAYALRFDSRIPPDRLIEYRRTLVMLLAIRLPVHFAFGIHRWSYRLSGLHEAARVVAATLTASAGFVSLFFFLQRAAVNIHIGPPRAVIVIEFFMTTALMGALRFSPRFVHTWFLDRARSRAGKVRTLIVGAGSAGELLLRDLHRSDEHQYDVIGFVDDNPAKWGASIGGRLVLGSIDDLPEISRRRAVRKLLFAIPRLPAAQLRAVLGGCAHLKLNYNILPVSFAYLNDRVSASMLQELGPEDLLSRNQVRFDTDEMRALIEGRRILVTGAAGSIGSELCRQVAAYSPASLVLVDIAENGLYYLFRDLEHRFPRVALAVEVADIRDELKMQQVIREHRPQDVFHAAAHKHVPLLERAPEEAIKNNVSGTRNVARAAAASGAERFLLISTDKAVNPAGVMGASKRIAELIVRDYGARSSTHFGSVRFGNVLGSAGSVVPLFKTQIAEGGPVTVTHPECSRYLMTISEAVGLVLLAGLKQYGHLCILEMGEPIRILDLARLMITMAGRVPDEDIRIAFTGLRPGEKIHEQLMTEEEAARGHRLHDMIRAIDVDPPPPSVVEQIERLEALAQCGDRERTRALLASIVPSYAAAFASDRNVENWREAAFT